MEILKGTLLNVFKNERTIKKDGKDETFIDFKASITKKNGDQYERMPIRVNFAGDLGKKAAAKFETKKCYEIEIHKGFLSFDKWTGNDGNNHYILVIVVTEAKVKSVKDVKTKDESASDPLIDSLF